MAYKEVEGSSDSWKPEKDGDCIEGVYIEKKSDVGEFNKEVYTLEIAPGKTQDVWGCTILDSRMKAVEIGSKVRITYKGEAEKGGKFGNKPKVFKVEVDDSTAQSPATPVGTTNESTQLKVDSPKGTTGRNLIKTPNTEKTEGYAYSQEEQDVMKQLIGVVTVATPDEDIISSITQNLKIDDADKVGAMIKVIRDQSK